MWIYRRKVLATNFAVCMCRYHLELFSKMRISWTKWWISLSTFTSMFPHYVEKRKLIYLVLKSKCQSKLTTSTSGDQLTVARIRGGQQIRANSESASRRLQGFVPMVEDWHANQCFMGVSIEKKIYFIAWIIVIWMFRWFGRDCCGRTLTKIEAHSYSWKTWSTGQMSLMNPKQIWMRVRIF